MQKTVKKRKIHKQYRAQRKKKYRGGVNNIVSAGVNTKKCYNMQKTVKKRKVQNQCNTQNK